MLFGLALSLCTPGVTDEVALATNIVAVGDSITYGTGSASPGGATSYPAYLATELGKTFNTDVHNQGVPSRISNDLPDVDYLLDETKQNILLVMIGVNDIYVASQTAADVFDRIQTYVAAQEAKGWLVIVGTITGNNVGNATTYGRAVALNALIVGGFDYVADVGADPDIGTAVNGTPLSGTYFTGDNLHLTATGNQRIADIFAVAVEAADPVSAPAIEDSYGISRDASLKVWLRDRNLVGPVNANAYELYNLSKPLVQDTYVAYADLSSTTPPLRVANVINGHPIARYAGGVDAGGADNFGYHVMPSLTLASLITASSFYFQAVFIPRAIYTNNVLSRTNAAVFGSSVAHVGLYLKSSGKVVFEQNYDTEVEGNISIDTPTVVGVRLHGGTLSMEIDGAVVDSTACANVADLTENFRVGNNYQGIRLARIDLAELIVRNSGAANTDAAYAMARYLP